MSIGYKILKNLKLIHSIILYKINKEKYIVIRAPITMKNGMIEHYNWGDDMNYYLAEMMCKKKVIPITDSHILRAVKIDSYLLIGSTITFYPLDNVTVWGAGIINQHDIDKISGRPKRICAVRGPLTRKALLYKGYTCPEIYGDPILLLPRFYSPSVKEKKYDIGIVPHYIDIETDIIGMISRDKNIRIIDVQKYDSWKDFVDQICSCRYILSSSLHGLICSEAYGIPSAWVGFSEYIDGWDFKFKDFYLSINKMEAAMTRIQDPKDIYSKNIMDTLQSWKPGVIDLDLLYSKCPFNITELSESKSI